jgi:presenilin 1
VLAWIRFEAVFFQNLTSSFLFFVFQGDFIFYSILVSKAALYSFTTFAACMLVILAGLGATLVLLAVYGKALPALPISIFLGVSFYLLTRLFLEPWIQCVLTLPFYV